MPNLRNTAAIGKDLGSSRMAIVEHDSDYLATGQVFFLPVIETSDTVEGVANTTKEDEEGVVTTFDGAKTITKNVTIMQRDLDSLRLKRTLADKSFLWVKEMSRDADPDGNYIYEYGLGAKVSGNSTTTGKSGSIPLAFNVTPNDAAVGLNLSVFDDVKFKGDFSTATLVTMAAGYGVDWFAVSAQ